VRPPFAVEPEPGQTSVWNFPRPPRLDPSRASCASRGMRSPSRAELTRWGYRRPAIRRLERRRAPPVRASGRQFVLRVERFGALLEHGRRRSPAAVACVELSATIVRRGSAGRVGGVLREWSDLHRWRNAVRPQPGGFTEAGWRGTCPARSRRVWKRELVTSARDALVSG